MRDYDAHMFRKDCCGAWIKRDQYNNRDSDFGWEVDHIYPESLLKERGASDEEIKDIRNLRPMNWRNNVSKGINYPIYKSYVTAENNKNVEREEEYEVNKDIQNELRQVYSKYYD